MKTDNELIAEFMGLKPYEDSRYGTMWPDPTNQNKVGFALKYDTSWDWLMPVVEKIQKECSHRIVIDGSKCRIVGEHSIKVHTIKTINSAYKAVVEFIKWHNETSGAGTDEQATRADK